MDGYQAEAARPPVVFAVDGTRVELPEWHWYPHRWAGGAFTTDYAQLRRLLPSQLHPARVSRTRALVCISGAYVAAAGFRPPFIGFGEVAVMAFVTRGEQPAPPLVPGMGRWAVKRYGFGFFPLGSVVTNRTAAEIYRILFGIPAAVADLRIEHRLDHERFVCARDGRLIIDLTVRSDGRAASGSGGAEDPYYVVEQGELYRMPVGGSGVSRSRFGRKAATLVVGDHHLADGVRRLGLNRAWAAEFSPDRHLWQAGPPGRLGPAERQTEMITLRETAPARLVVSPTPKVEFEVDQGYSSLGWDPGSVFSIPTLRERSMVTR